MKLPSLATVAPFVLALVDRFRPGASVATSEDVGRWSALVVPALEHAIAVGRYDGRSMADVLAAWRLSMRALARSRDRQIAPIDESLAADLAARDFGAAVERRIEAQLRSLATTTAAASRRLQEHPE